jgi:hypothetical protein
VLQIGIGLDIQFFSNFNNSFYPIDLNLWTYSELKSLSDFNEVRFAGIFYNPNVMGLNMLLLFCCLLKFIKSNNNIIATLFVLSFFSLSILLTGSRTAMLTFLIINYFAFRKHFTKNTFVLVISLLFVIGLFYFPTLARLLSSFRVFDIGSTFSTDGSGEIKINLLLDWLSQLFLDANFNFFEFIFGVGSIPIQFDFDFGYILQMCGVFGMSVLIILLVKIYHKTMYQYRFIFYLFFISIGATLIINFRNI